MSEGVLSPVELLRAMKGKGSLSSEKYYVEALGTFVVNGKPLSQRQTFDLCIEIAYQIKFEDLPRFLNSSIRHLRILAKKRMETEG